jgi:hypothetical protein
MFNTVDGEWQTIDVPLSDFVPVFRARMLRGADAKPLDASSVYSLQLMLSKFEFDGARALSDVDCDRVPGKASARGSIF